MEETRERDLVNPKTVQRSANCAVRLSPWYTESVSSTLPPVGPDALLWGHILPFVLTPIIPLCRLL